MNELSTVFVLLLGTLAAPPHGVKLLAKDAPLEFRCNGMQIFTKPNKTICLDDVVVRRGNLLVCCEKFEGLADEDWGWKSFVCSGNVRAQRGDELMWSNKAEFILSTSDLILTGQPMLRRGKSLLNGERIVVDIENDRARVEKPRGRFQSANDPVPAVVPFPMEGPLPARCPVPGKH